MSRPATEYASPAQAAGAIWNMSDSDMLKLHSFARFRAIGLPWLDATDLLHDAIVRVVSGIRRWPSEVPFIFFMKETIRSIANEHWRQRVDGPIVTEADLSNPGSSYDATAADDSIGAEREVIATQILERIENLFAQDEVALAVIKDLQSGYSPNEIQRRTAMTKTQYASTQKRIRRTLARHFPTEEAK
jgi:RNA polymerase sigma-70 factor (ECF subfamily)